MAMFASEVAVTVTGEIDHQAVLTRHRPGATVAVELGWCTIRTGKHSGEQAIEVLLDGQRVGELTHAMSRRYGPAVSWVLTNGGRPGCWARITTSAKGTEIVLRLPKDPTTIPNSLEPAQAIIVPPTRKARPWMIAAAVFALIVFLISVSDTDDPPAADNAANTAPATTTTTTTTTTPPPTTTTTTTTPPPTTTTTTTPPPPPPPSPRRVVTEEPVPPPPPPPAPKPKPAPSCDPNYSGCVPVASDVDCAGGSGNGPAYVQGPIRVTGDDVYGLDNDGDGVACES